MPSDLRSAIAAAPSAHASSLGHELAQKLRTRPWPEVHAWLQAEQGDLLERIVRLRNADDDYRLDQARRSMPADVLAKVPYRGRPLAVYRGMPERFDIRPGDWVALDPQYARSHAHDTHHGAGAVKHLDAVHGSDIYWSGTDEREFFYLPAAWRERGDSLEDYLRRLPADAVRMLCDGELSSITRNAQALQRLRFAAEAECDANGLMHGDHGPYHWARVATNAIAVARSLGVDPLVGVTFALTHDCQRHDEGADPDHGRRAAAFIRANPALFDFLPAGQIDVLARACAEHSDGLVDDQPLVQSCHDADRLDLWRVSTRPDPDYMGSAYAKRADVIAACRQTDGWYDAAAADPAFDVEPDGTAPRF